MLSVTNINSCRKIVISRILCCKHGCITSKCLRVCTFSMLWQEICTLTVINVTQLLLHINSLPTTNVFWFKAIFAVINNVVWLNVMWQQRKATVVSRKLNQLPFRRSAVCLSCMTPASTAGCQSIWMGVVFSIHAIKPMLLVTSCLIHDILCIMWVTEASQTIFQCI